MFFKLGQEVVLKFTGDKGKITEIHSDGMVVEIGRASCRERV